jgi:G3E family GTPase
MPREAAKGEPMAAREQRRDRLPITIVGGFLGSGKTSIIQRMLAERASQRVAVLTGDSQAGAENQRRRPRTPAVLESRMAKLVRPSQECLARMSEEGWVQHLSDVSADGSIDSLIVELDGAADPSAIANLFSAEVEPGLRLTEVAELRAVVVVIDAVSFFDDYAGFERVATRSPAIHPEDQRYVARVLADQVESADLIVLSKVDRVSNVERALLEATLREMNPSAQFTQHPEDLGVLGGSQRSGAVRMSGAVQPRQAVSSFVYEARRPFHPERVRALFERDWPGVLRSRGVFWLATRMSEVGCWSQAGGAWEIARAGYWWATLPKEMWSTSPQLCAAVQELWREPFGDRRQELRFVGLELNESQLRASFDECLLTDTELSAGPEGWARLADPFARWSDVVRWGSPTRTGVVWH